jgi:hypothetical protein
MAKTTTVSFTGKTMWFRPGFIDREFEDPDNGRGGNYSIQMELDEASVRLFNGLNPKAKLKNGNVAKFSRYEYANFGNGPEPLGPPVYTGFDEGVAVGNGSDVTVRVDAYPYTFKGRPGTALRLVSVHVDNLVEYIRPTVDNPEAHDNAPPVH